MENVTHLNKDVLDGRQIVVDYKRRNDIKTLSEEDKNKHVVVEQALNTLAVNGIRAFIYAELPNPKYTEGESCVYQYNTLQNLMKFDEEGNPTDESLEKLSKFNCAMWNSLFVTKVTQAPNAKKLGIDKFPWRDEKQFNTAVDYFVQSVLSCVYTHNKSPQ